MKLYLVLAIISLLTTSALTVEFTEEEGVIVLDDQNFDEALKKYNPLLVEFYAPWCGHCKELAPHYAKAAQTLKNDPNPFYLAKVDATVNTELAKKFEIEGFPSMKIFSHGKDPEDYNGGRTEPEIVQYLRRKTGPVTQTFTTVKEVTDFAAANEVAVVFFGAEDNLHKLYTELANAYDDLVFGECKTNECLNHFNVQNGNVVIFRKFDPKNAELRTAYTAEELKSFVDGNTTKLVSPFDEKVAQLVFGKQVPGLFFYRAKGSESEALYDELAHSVAEELKGKIQVVVTDIQDGLEQRLAEYIGITSTELPSVRIHDTREDLKKYNLEGAVTKESILAFVKDWLDGKLVQKLKSEDVSVTNDNKGAVLPLVGLNFAEYVYNKNKHVLVEFYAPWCGHCKKLQPVYDELAEKLKTTNPDIVIAKVDSTANDVEGQDIQGFPTLKLYTKTDKVNAVDFDGERDLAGLVDFLQKNIPEFVRPEGIVASAPSTNEEHEEEGNEQGGEQGSEQGDHEHGEAEQGDHSHGDQEDHEHGNHEGHSHGGEL